MKVKREEVGKVIEKLKELGGKEEKAPEGVAARFKFGQGVVQVYSTGSITFGGKEREKLKERVEKALADEVLKGRSFPIVGCDEAGKGEFFGPLAVACVWADKKAYRELLKLGVKDSKKLKEEKIFELDEKIRKICHGKVRVLMPEEYNRLYRKLKNQNRLLEEIYLQILKELVEKYGAKEIVIDKFSRKIGERVKGEFPEIEVVAVEKGENEPVVAAAAVVAKAARLRGLKRLSKELGREIREGNAENGELLKAIPERERYRFVKEHFKVED
ncbi:ribonuclease HIII [Thermovibrio sp.]